MIKLGMIDFDTSHVVEFARRLNHRGIPEDQWVEGASVVIACPGESKIMPERIADHTEQIRKLEIPLVDRPRDMLGKVDGVLIESQEGGAHWPRAQPFLEAGLPCFIDKPFTCGVEDARRIAELARKRNVPVFSSSSLRYSPELVEFVTDTRHGKVIGALSYGPASLHERNPGLFHYGIHAVEVLYTLMGPGCERVVCGHEPHVDVVTGRWKDGRIASVRGIRKGRADYGALVFTEQGVRPLAIGTRYIYRELLKQIVAFFQSRQPPIDLNVTVEIVAFIEAALRSEHNHGIEQRLQA